MKNLILHGFLNGVGFVLAMILVPVAVVFFVHGGYLIVCPILCYLVWRKIGRPLPAWRP